VDVFCLSKFKDTHNLPLCFYSDFIRKQLTCAAERFDKLSSFNAKGTFMADFLIQHLENKAKEHSALTMLVNQWGFDEKLIPKALQTVSSLFPHYSRHDESHSRQILINIERLLGKDGIAQLTATDTWLLLEAAYWHDIGMVVPQKDIENALNHQDFPAYLDQIRNSPHHELHRFTINFNFHNMSQCFAGADTPIEAVDKFRQLMAEWFRRQHAERASKTIENPWTSAGISSPRTELIPARLFKLLGRICHLHGLPFQDILAPNGLPFREAGLAQEDCHPRFVACLLRMGDLLDLDDNRFCPVMQGIAGSQRSCLSKAHEDKHAGMRHLRIDRDRIEVTAECATVEGYLEAFKWFDWLKQEMQNQMSHWRDIAPNRKLGLLPTLGDFEVRLSGEQQILKEGHRPQFSIDGAQAIKLLQGNNLYDSKFACIRELLQNAVDATLLRLWLTHEKTESPETWKTPFSERAQAILKTNNVEVSLEEATADADTPSDKSRWTLKIIDQGTGISREDLSYMLRIGGSQSNAFRQAKIRYMPEWMKPSGAFGIGFQSVYMICDVVKLTTKSAFTNETLEVIMHNPLGEKEGLVILKPLENEVSHPYGTTVELNLYFDKFARTWSLPNDATSIHAHFIREFDPVLDQNFPLEAAHLADKINKFSTNALLPIHGKLTTIEKPASFKLGSDDLAPPPPWRFVEVNGHQLALQYQAHVQANSEIVAAQYRGQTFEQKGLTSDKVLINVNLLSGKAGSWLTADRDKLADSAKKEFHELVLAALEKLVREDLTNFQISNELKPAFSLFLASMATQYGNNWLDLADKLGRAWLDLQIPYDMRTYRELFERDEWFLKVKMYDDKQPSNCDLTIYSHQHGYFFESLIINAWLKQEHQTVQIIEDDNTAILGSPLRYQFKKEPQPSYSQGALAIRLEELAQGNHYNQRFWLDFQDEDGWDAIHIKKGTKLRAYYLFERPVSESKNFVLLPFLFRTKAINGTASPITATPAQLDALCKCVQPYLKTPASLEDIRKTYDRLIDHIDNNIMRPSPHWEVWKTARGID
jgi:hypothetical protein